jgi:SAM-dependent methyltransferase
MNHPGAPFWVPSAALQRHVNRTASGDPGVDWLSHVRTRNLPAELARTLVVGCGEGFLERALARMPGVRAITAVDADAAAVGRARRRAALRGLGAVSHAVLDPDAEEPPAGPWDAILVHNVLHHAARPEELLGRLHAALAPRGRFVCLEYVGPDRFQYSDARMEIVRRYFRLLPERLRRDPDTGRGAWRRERPDAAALARAQPHEAARSEDLVALTRRQFAQEALYSGGGGLLHPLLSGLERNFGRDGADDERVLEVLCAAETHLTAEGLVADDFAIFVGRRRTSATAAARVT